MSELAIRVEGLSKCYRIGARVDRFRTLRDAVAGMIGAPLRRLRRGKTGVQGLQDFWALKDVSLEVAHGALVGIIGQNGAGKSTLLKILSRITEPTSGSAEIRGRVGSLLEVGTGFHPELSGRDNVYLSGAILGMKRRDIERRFEEIVAFAEVERFVDTTVKHYSSGMSTRLAFSVAAHLEPEILLIDEVLAVGDVAFQKKCLGKMGEVVRDGRTVVFVSHNMSALANLCTTAFRLEAGRLVDTGETLRVIQDYLTELQSSEEEDLSAHPGRKPRQRQRPILRHVRLLRDSKPGATFRVDETFGFEVDCTYDPADSRSLALAFQIRSGVGTVLFGSDMGQYHLLAENSTGRIRFRVSLERLCLAPGAYSLSLSVGNGSYELDSVADAIAFSVVWSPRPELAYPPPPSWGPMFLPVAWESTAMPDSNLESPR